MANYPFTDTGVESFFDAVQEQMDRILRGAGLPATLRALPRGHFPPVNIAACRMRPRSWWHSSPASIRTP